MNNKKRIMFTFNVDNIIDLITNSSSELFTMVGDTKEEVIEMIKSVYPDYLNEYEEVKCINELSNDELSLYISYKYDDWTNKLILSEQFKINPVILYDNWGEWLDRTYWYPNVSDKGFELIKQQLPDNIYMLFSIDENPNWEMQEELRCIGTRYHLG